jgi:hypothetical protein
MTMTCTIEAITDQVTPEGKKQLGFVTDRRKQDGTPIVIFPLFQNIVQPDKVGMTFIAECHNGKTIERVV